MKRKKEIEELISELNNLLDSNKAPKSLSIEKMNNLGILSLRYNAVLDEYNSSHKQESDAEELTKQLWDINLEARKNLGAPIPSSLESPSKKLLYLIKILLTIPLFVFIVNSINHLIFEDVIPSIIIGSGVVLLILNSQVSKNNYSPKYQDEFFFSYFFTFLYLVIGFILHWLGVW